MTTASDLIDRAAGKIGVANLKSAERTIALSVLNDIVDAWNAERLTLFQEYQEQFTLTTSASYTIGSAGAFNTTRPEIIISAFYRESGGTVDFPIRLTDKTDWDLIPSKTVSGIPEILWYDTAYPLGTINVYPQKAGLLLLTSARQLTEFASTSTTVSFPPGYRRAFIHNLAVDLAAEFEIQVPPQVAAIASSSLRVIKNANRKRVKMQNEFSTIGNCPVPNINRGY